MPIARKQFDSPFVLEKSKLRRLIEAIESKLKENGRTPEFDFEAHLHGQKVVETASIDEILALDNSKRNRVERLVFSCTTSDPNTKTVDRGSTVEFDGRARTQIYFAVKGDNAGWVGETFRTVEEQVERTLVQSIMNRLSHRRFSEFYLASLALVLLMIVLVFTLTTDLMPARLTNAMWLTNQDLKELGTIQSDPALAREKAGEVLSHQIHNLAVARQQRYSIIARATQWRSILLIIPSVLILAALAYLYFRCYPSAVFLWGDAEEWYKSLQQRRRFIWTAVVAAFVIGVLANLFVVALANHN